MPLDAEALVAAKFGIQIPPGRRRRHAFLGFEDFDVEEFDDSSLTFVAEDR